MDNYIQAPPPIPWLCLLATSMTSNGGRRTAQRRYLIHNRILVDDDSVNFHSDFGRKYRFEIFFRDKTFGQYHTEDELRSAITKLLSELPQ